MQCIVCHVFVQKVFTIRVWLGCAPKFGACWLLTGPTCRTCCKRYGTCWSIVGSCATQRAQGSMQVGLPCSSQSVSLCRHQVSRSVLTAVTYNLKELRTCRQSPPVFLGRGDPKRVLQTASRLVHVSASSASQAEAKQLSQNLPDSREQAVSILWYLCWSGWPATAAIDACDCTDQASI